MGWTRARLLFGFVAAASIAGEALGTYLYLAAGRDLGGWQLTCLGVGVPAAILGLLIAWHRPRNRIAWLFAAASLGFALELVGLGILQSTGNPPPLQRLAYIEVSLAGGPLTTVWVLLILLFPDGRFHRRLWARFAVGAAAVAITASTVQFLIAPPGFLPQEYGTPAPAWLAGPFGTGAFTLPLARLLDAPGALLPVIAVTGLLDRYRLGSSTVRQQIKWLLYAVALNVVFQAASVALRGVRVELPAALTLAVAPLPVLAAALAVFRYRLWEIDRLVARTLAFALLWGLSTVLFVGFAVIAGVVVGGSDVRLVVALGLAVLIALLVQPLRDRLEASITRRVYGDNPRGYGALAGLTTALQRPLPPGELSSLVAIAARDALGSPWAAVWLLVEGENATLLRLAAAVGESDFVARLEATPAIFDPAADPGRFPRVLPDSAQSVVPLTAGDETIGLLACGSRGTEESSSDDLDLLAMIAHQSAITLRNTRLEQELRQRMSELQESRQRLVGAQDEERRRLERDLHDGVQQQLVSLAAKLKRASSFAVNEGSLSELAADAEDAVFALQDLARGIYPAVLADQGLASALRSHAVRVPLEVHVEVEPQLVERRFDGELEAGLYFVALEAVTNAQKHARDAAITITLRTDLGPPGLVLEIHDDGAGFDTSSKATGSGLQNMKDRISALGGTLVVQSRPKAGTWIRASVPVAAEIVSAQLPGISARR
jgi:signal transduction histidine kinase